MPHVKIVEVGPRDGLQNIQQLIPTELKVQLIQRLASTGLSTIEATSFVSPKWVPQLADGRAVLQHIKQLMRNSTTKYPVLVPNLTGLDAAIDAGAREVSVFVSATEGFSRKNTNCTIEESLDRVRAVANKAKSIGISIRGYVSCIFACPYDGPTAPSQVISVVQALLNAGCYEISLGDTLGVGTPADVERLLQPLLQAVPAHRLAGHFHDTYGQAIANVLKSYDMGLRIFDSSVAGLGGCPFAKGAKGNLASEDIIYTFGKMGISTGVDLDRLVEVGAWISGKLGIPNGSRAGSALTAKAASANKSSEAIGRNENKISNKRPWETVESTSEYTMSRRGADVKITLTLPKNGNALTLAMVHSLTKAISAISKDRTIFRLILTAQGKYFCTGMDLGHDAGTPDAQFQALKTLFETIDNCPQTTIAAINGPCFGGGIGLAFACDLRLATAAAHFTLSEAKLGLCPATISIYVVREWGFSFSRAAMLTARAVAPAELLALGAVQAISSDQAGLDVLLEEYLERLRVVAPRASVMCKELVRQAWTDGGGEGQARAIKAAFDEMMAEGSESKVGLEKFRGGVKEVDWESLVRKRTDHKL